MRRLHKPRWINVVTLTQRRFFGEDMMIVGFQTEEDLHKLTDLLVNLTQAVLELQVEVADLKQAKKGR